MQRIRAPGIIYWDITPSCNLKCKHCYSKEMINFSKMQLNDNLAFINEIAKMKVFQLEIVGREPLLYRNLFDVLKEIKDKKIVVSIATNGTLITEDIAKEFYALNVKNVQISIDSPTPKLHDEYRGQVGAWKKAIEGCNFLFQQKVPINISMTLTNFNHQFIAQMVELSKNIGAKLFRIRRLIPNSNSRLYLVTPDQYRSVVNDMFRLRCIEKKIYIEEAPLEFLLEKKIPYLPEKEIRIPCGAGTTRCSITYNASITPCVALGSEFEEEFFSFEESWKNKNTFKKWTNIFSNIEGKCGICGYRYYCGGDCRALAYKVTGSQYSSDPYCWFEPKGVKK